MYLSFEEGMMIIIRFDPQAILTIQYSDLFQFPPMYDSILEGE